SVGAVAGLLTGLVGRHQRDPEGRAPDRVAVGSVGACVDVGRGVGVGRVQERLLAFEERLSAVLRRAGEGGVERAVCARGDQCGRVTEVLVDVPIVVGVARIEGLVGLEEDVCAADRRAGGGGGELGGAGGGVGRDCRARRDEGGGGARALVCVPTAVGVGRGQ